MDKCLTIFLLNIFHPEIIFNCFPRLSSDALFDNQLLEDLRRDVQSLRQPMVTDDPLQAKNRKLSMTSSSVQLATGASVPSLRGTKGGSESLAKPNESTIASKGAERGHQPSEKAPNSEVYLNGNRDSISQEIVSSSGFAVTNGYDNSPASTELSQRAPPHSDPAQRKTMGDKTDVRATSASKSIRRSQSGPGDDWTGGRRRGVSIRDEFDEPEGQTGFSRDMNYWGSERERRFERLSRNERYLQSGGSVMIYYFNPFLSLVCDNPFLSKM